MLRRRGLMSVGVSDKRLWIFDGSMHGQWGAIKLSSSSYYWFPNYRPDLDGRNMTYSFGSGVYFQGAYCDIPINFDDYSKVVITFEDIVYPTGGNFCLTATRTWGDYIVGDYFDAVTGNTNFLSLIPQGTPFPHTAVFDIGKNLGTGYIGFSVYQEYGGDRSISISEMYLE